MLRLGTAQTLAWGSTYYLPALLARPMAEGLGLPISQIWIAFTVALLASAVLGPFAGRAIDRWGGRPVLMGTSVLFALGLASLSQVQGSTSLMLAWLLIGMAMGSGLYEAAFAALVRLHGTQARAAITGITLIAGFASTVGWPLTALLETEFGWRGACLGWAGLHLLLGLPLNASIPRATALPEPPQVVGADAPTALPHTPPPRHTAWLLSYVFAATWFISTAMAAHLPQLLVASGATLAGAVAIGALVGPAQVAGRMLEFGFLRRLHPLRISDFLDIKFDIVDTVFGTAVSEVLLPPSRTPSGPWIVGYSMVVLSGVLDPARRRRLAYTSSLAAPTRSAFPGAKPGLCSGRGRGEQVH